MVWSLSLAQLDREKAYSGIVGALNGEGESIQGGSSDALRSCNYLKRVGRMSFTH
jgi:hypothetical protein